MDEEKAAVVEHWVSSIGVGDDEVEVDKEEADEDDFNEDGAGRDCADVDGADGDGADVDGSGDGWRWGGTSSRALKQKNLIIYPYSLSTSRFISIVDSS